MDTRPGSIRPERRTGERRTQKRWFVLHERRSGFDRRRTNAEGAGVRVDRVLRWLRERPRAVVWLLVSANVLNLLDLLLTVNVLLVGASEANPVMAWLFDTQPALAWIFKIGTIAAASTVLWGLRKFRLALAATVCFAAVFGLVLVYDLVGLAVLYW
ncbi:MAG: DUF5658 family protein [Thermoleophilia bacterium]|nr:DUF5658 family protein [Thermoleophilia bacterium]